MLQDTLPATVQSLMPALVAASDALMLGTFVLHWEPMIVYAYTCPDEVGKIPWTIHHYKKYRWVKDLTR